MEDVKLVLTMVNALVKSGRKELVDKAERTLEALKKAKVLDWKVR